MRLSAINSFGIRLTGFHSLDSHTRYSPFEQYIHPKFLAMQVNSPVHGFSTVDARHSLMRLSAINSFGIRLTGFHSLDFHTGYSPYEQYIHPKFLAMQVNSPVHGFSTVDARHSLMRLSAINSFGIRLTGFHSLDFHTGNSFRVVSNHSFRHPNAHSLESVPKQPTIVLRFNCSQQTSLCNQ